MNPIFGFSEAANIGMHAMVMLACSDGRGLNLPELARLLSASEAHLAKVMQRLRKTGLITATRGPGGGYKLAREPEDITLLNIYHAIEGLSEHRHTSSSKCPIPPCKFEALLSEMNKRVFEYLDGHTLASMRIPNDTEKFKS